MTLIFLDTEFTNLTFQSELISIALVDEAGNGFYGECDDFNKNTCSDFVYQNVIPQLGNLPTIVDTLISVRGNYHQIARSVYEFIESYKDDSYKVTIVTDVAYYDWKFFFKLPCFKPNLPEYISPFPIDLNSMILARNGTTDISRNSLSSFPESIHGIKLHHAYYDAMLLKECYFELMSTES
ncbi:MAG: 3'-5' exoribonuclease [Bacteroidia bacterium]|nr:3'-5' exoribonuclease [Bacteroidia bacterium]